MKMFVTFDQRRNSVRDNRVDGGIITKVLRGHLQAYLKLNEPELSTEQINEIVQRYSSHSFKHGLATDAFMNGESGNHIQYGLESISMLETLKTLH
mmetsp:Transcript_14769/g.18900  ORF Transcript_14769/g.18900 Transcript_14769/m.18900 type:complete len:96 (+) Transcript_14769:114-401(+)